MATKVKSFSLFLFYYLPTIVWACVIYHASSYPTAEVSTVYWQEFILKKFAHIVVYGILTVLTYRALLKSNVSKWNAGILAIVVTFFYGLSDEFHQRFTPSRDSAFRDTLIDTISSVFTVLFIWNILPKVPKQLLSLAKKLELL